MRYFIYTTRPNDLIDGSVPFISSPRLRYSQSVGLRTTDNKVQHKAFTPCVSENTSTASPIQKENVITQLMPRVMGRRNMKYMNTNGNATLYRHKLLNTTACANTSRMNIIIYLSITRVISCYYRGLRVADREAPHHEFP